MSAQHTRLNLSAALASVAVSLVILVMAAWTLSQTQSLAVAAVLADSALDLLVSATGLAAILYATRPPDHDHAYGHASAEDLAALGQAVFLTGVSLALAAVAIQRLLSPQTVQLGNETLGMAVMGGTVLLNGVLILWQRFVAARTGNRVVAADTLNRLADLLPAIGAMVALWMSQRFGITGVDTIVALLGAGILALGALRIFGGAWQALMDRGADPDLVADVGRLLAETEGIQGYHDLRSRTAGSRIFIDGHVDLDGSLSLAEAHDIAARAKRKILAEHPEIDLLLHMDPVRSAGPAKPRR